MSIKIMIFLAAAFLVGTVGGYFLRMLLTMGKRGSMELEIKQKIVEAKEEASRILDESKKKAETRELELKKEERDKEAESKKTEDRLIKKEDLLDARQIELDRENEHSKKKIEFLNEKEEKVVSLEKEKQDQLTKIAKKTKEEALEDLFSSVEKEHEEDLLIRTQKLEHANKEKLDARARDILVMSIQRMANANVSEFMMTNVVIPSDEVKGKIIGKEGRNIRAFERAAGVELIVDDTPGMVVISAFDPVRRQVARVALENLISDGRIQPAKIEETVKKSQEEINNIIKKKGEEAVYELGIYNFDPRIVAILGRLYFRTSYGQNVLQHSVEMAHISAMIAEEIGADVAVAKAGALVHDIGKALTHEVQGSHVDIGIRILQKFGAEQSVIDAMKSHHEEYPYETVEAHIVQAADAISGGRPGARRDSVENYLKRLRELEAIATEYKGVEKAYALSAGREIRVFVTPSKMTDIEAKEAARDIVKKIEADLKYPGEIKVVVIRENRIVEFAR
ncbi:MAG: ribonuclease Y [Candidatus Paceibacteria bacterium]|jgi:ribonuclease Y